MSAPEESYTASDYLQLMMVEGSAAAEGAVESVVLASTNQNSYPASSAQPIYIRNINTSGQQDGNGPLEVLYFASSTPQEGDGHECTICGKGFPTARGLKTHMVTHAEDKPHKCPICLQGFSHASTLIRHKRTHTGETPYVCGECGYACKQSQPLKAHYARHHPHIQVPVPTMREKIQHICKCCSTTCSSKVSLEEHVREQHPEAGFPCEICTKTFASISGLKDHMATIHGQGGVTCTVCGKKCAGQAKLKVHMITHANKEEKIQAKLKKLPPPKKPNMCPRCGKCFGTMASFKYHKQTCDTDITYTCSECIEVFYQQEMLDIHMKTHKPFSCSECRESFATLPAAKLHMRATHPPV